MAGAIVVFAVAVVVGCSGDAADESPSAVDESTTVESTVVDMTSDSTTSTDAAEDDTTEVIESDNVEIPEYDFSAVEAIIDDFVVANGLNGAGLAIVDRDHGIVYEGYWGDLGPERVSFVASSSKMVSAGVLLYLADAGLLDLDAPVADNLAGIADWGVGNPAITPAQLVSGGSGLVGLGPDPGYSPYICQFLHTGTLADCAAQVFTTPEDDGDIAPPDAEFRYGGAAWQVAGGLAEAVSGKSWAELIEEIYVEPCGLTSFGYNNHFGQLPGGFTYPTGFDGDLSVLAPTDNPNLEGGLYTTVPDYAEVLLMHLRDGECPNGRVLSPESIARAHVDRIVETDGEATSYGFGWWVDPNSSRITVPGAYGSVAWIDTEGDFGGFLVVEAVSTVGSQLAAEIFDPVAAALAAG